MKFRFRGNNLVLAASLLILSSGPAFGQEPAARSAAAVEIPGTEVHTLTSSIDGQEYAITSCCLPATEMPPGGFRNFTYWMRKQTSRSSKGSC